MRRMINYAGAIPLDTDLLNTNKETMMALGFFAQAVLGTTTCVDGLACTPTAVPSLSVNVAPGSIYSFGAVDATSYGALAADTTHSIVKQGILYSTSQLTFSPPGTPGYSINYLIEGQYQEVDDGSTVLPYYNSANPAVAWSGPANAGTAQNTQRSGYLVLATKAGTAAATGSQVTPTVDSGYVPLWVITVAYGATAINTPQITVHPAAPFINPKLFGLLQNMTGLTHYGTDTGGASAIVATVTPAITALTAGLTCFIKVATATTGATTMNISALGAAPLLRGDGTAIQANDIKAGQVICAVYDGVSSFYLQSSSQLTVTNDFLNAGNFTGSANAIIATCVPTAQSSPDIGATCVGTLAFTNTSTAVTIKVDGGATSTVLLADNATAPSVGSLIASHVIMFRWNGTRWLAMMDLTAGIPVGSSGGTAYLPLAGGTMTGPITSSGNPTVALHMANKQYVDGLIGGLVSAGTLVGVQSFVASGTYTPTSGATRALVFVTGAGGAGGGVGTGGSAGSAGSGGGAETRAAFVTVSGTVSVTIGAGGSGGSGAGSYGGNGTAGGNSSFGSITANGGGGGLGATGTYAAGGAAGTGGSGGVLIPGNPGTNGGNYPTTGGAGGGTFWGPGASFPPGTGAGGGIITGGQGNNGVSYGAGGSAANGNSNGTYSGGNGAGGFVFILEYK